MADTNAQIKKQIEFYFGDSNFPKDKHLLIQAKLHPEGFVPIAHLLTFKRMQQITTDPAVVAEAVANSEVVTLSSDKQSVKRTNPLPEEDTSLPRKIYTKGWTGDDLTIEKVTEIFAPHGNVLSVRLRRKKTGEFKGSVLIEFDTEETAKKVLELAPQPEGQTLAYQTALAWTQEKREQSQAFLKSKKDKSAQAKQERSDAARKVEEESSNADMKGTIVKFDGVGEGLDREALQPIFSTYGTIKYTDFVRGNTSGFIRFSTPEEATKAVETITSSKLEFAGKVPTVSVLAGADEEDYLKLAAEKRSEKQAGREEEDVEARARRERVAMRAQATARKPRQNK